jgi:hypothetical protein
MTNVPNAPRHLMRDVGGMAYAKGSGRWPHVSMDMLRDLRERAPILAPIHSARHYQIRRLCQRWPGKKGTVGYRIVHKNHHEHDAVQPDYIKPFIEKFEGMLERPSPSYCKTTGAFMTMLWEDLATINRPVVEIIRSAVDPKRIVQFRPVDGGIIWPTLLWIEQWKKEHPNWRMGYDMKQLALEDEVDVVSAALDFDLHGAEWVLVRDGIAEQAYPRDKLIVAPIENRTDIRWVGYPPSHVEQAIHLIAGFISTFDYNASFFCATDQLVTTEHGLVRLSALVGKKFRIWNGRDWRPATAYETGPKPVVRTRLWNGLELRTSQEHRFRTIPADSETGEPEWRQQRHLEPGDTLLVDYAVSDPPLDYDVALVGEEYKSAVEWGRDWTPTTAIVDDLEFWEMIGFALGDGYWPDLTKRAGAVQWMQIFPHYAKDEALFDRFMKVCARHGINADTRTINKHQTRTDGANGYPVIQICHRTFIEWLSDLGFQASCYGRRVPDALYQLPANIRAAVMRGLFSADGHRARHVTGYCTPTLASSQPAFRTDIVTCMWSLGVAANEVGTGWDRGKTIIVAQDVPAFVERIGYLQDYKNESLTRSDKSATRWDRLHPAVSTWVADSFKQSDAWAAASSRDRSLVYAALSRGMRISRPRALNLLAQAGVEPPEALHYCHVPVDVLDAEPAEQEMMFDVEVFDDEHLFLLNHVGVHNTKGMMAEILLGLPADLHADDVDAFVDMFREATQGVQNAWQPPILPLEGDKQIQVIDLKKNNTEMGFETWLSLLVAFICAEYRMDTSTIGAKPWEGGAAPKLSEGNRTEEIALAKEEGLQGDITHLNENIINVLARRCHPDLKCIWEYGDFDPVKEVNIYEIRSRMDMTRNEVRLEQGLQPRGFWVPLEEYDDLSDEDQSKYDQNVWNWTTDEVFASAMQQKAMMDAGGAEGLPAGDGFGGNGGGAGGDGFGGEEDGFGGSAPNGGAEQPEEPAQTEPMNKGRTTVVHVHDTRF